MLLAISQESRSIQTHRTDFEITEDFVEHERSAGIDGGVRQLEKPIAWLLW